MLATKITIKDLNTCDSCYEAIADIENDSRNYIGGASRWRKGLECTLLASAVSKINAINLRADKLFAQLQLDNPGMFDE